MPEGSEFTTTDEAREQAPDSSEALPVDDVSYGTETDDPPVASWEQPETAPAAGATAPAGGPDPEEAAEAEALDIDPEPAAEEAAMTVAGPDVTGPDVAEQPDVEAEQADVEAEEAEFPESDAARPPEVKQAPPAAAAGGNGSAPAEADDLDLEDEEEYERDDPFLPGDWYVVHTYAGYENKVRANLGSRIQSMNMEDKIFDVVIPTEEVMEIKSGRRQLVQRKVFPGYILVRMLLDDDSWYVVRNTPGVTGFVGAGAKPTPLSASEVGKILTSKPAEARKPRLEFEVAEVVQVISGPFANMSGPVAEINEDQQKVKVLVDIFGRETPVELGFDQVAKL